MQPLGPTFVYLVTDPEHSYGYQFQTEQECEDFKNAVKNFSGPRQPEPTPKPAEPQPQQQQPAPQSEGSFFFS